MPKKKINAFYIFRKEFEAKVGKKNLTSEELTDAAGAVWQKMTEAQKKPYHEQAKSGNCIKYNCLGQNIDEVNRTEKEKIMKERLMEKYIDQIAGMGDSFLTRHYFVISVNYYCYYEVENKYFPAEITITRFSLKGGIDVDDIYHAIIEPGKFPIGYRFECTALTRDYHDIPAYADMVDYEPVRTTTTLEETYYEMKNYLEKYRDPLDEKIIVYALDADKNAVEGVLREIIGNDEDDFEVEVYSLQYLFFTIRNAARLRAGNGIAYPAKSLCDAIFEKDNFEFLRSLSCKFHKDKEHYYNCSMSRNMRKIFHICDYTLPDLEFDVIPGRHVPCNLDLGNDKKPVKRGPPQVQEREIIEPVSKLNINAAEFVVPETPIENKPETSNSAPEEQRIRRPISLSKVVQQNRPIAITNATVDEDFPILGAGRGRLGNVRGRGGHFARVNTK